MLYWLLISLETIAASQSAGTRATETNIDETAAFVNPLVHFTSIRSPSGLKNTSDDASSAARRITSTSIGCMTYKQRLIFHCARIGLLPVGRSVCMQQARSRGHVQLPHTARVVQQNAILERRGLANTS